MKKKCPHCNKSITIPNVMLLNVETYGDNHFHFICRNCSEMVGIEFIRTVKVVEMYKSDRVDESFSTGQMVY